MQQHPEPAWIFIGQSVRGATHALSDAPNQDALLPQPDQTPFAATYVAVSDGHGSAQSFRSQRGARIAVAVAEQRVMAFLREANDAQNGEIRRLLQGHLVRPIVEEWRKRVHKDIEREQFSDVELNTLQEKRGSVAVTEVQASPPLAYGATLLVALVTPHAIVLLQLGDGDILLVDKKGTVHQPLDTDERLVANETFSLCSDDAETLFRTKVISASETPALMLLSTDGYSNSFQHNDGFYQAAIDFYNLVREHGVAYIQQHLELWLNETSAGGSGDDITVGMLCRSDVLDPTARSTPANDHEAIPVADAAPAPMAAAGHTNVLRDLLGSPLADQRANVRLKAVPYEPQYAPRVAQPHAVGVWRGELDRLLSGSLHSPLLFAMLLGSVIVALVMLLLILLLTGARS